MPKTRNKRRRNALAKAAGGSSNKSLPPLILLLPKIDRAGDGLGVLPLDDGHPRYAGAANGMTAEEFAKSLPPV